MEPDQVCGTWSSNRLPRDYDDPIVTPEAPLSTEDIVADLHHRVGRGRWHHSERAHSVNDGEAAGDDFIAAKINLTLEPVPPLILFSGRCQTRRPATCDPESSPN
jgi:hypothetical protein